MKPTIVKFSLVKKLTLKSINLSTRKDRWRGNTFDVWQDTDKQTGGKEEEIMR